MGRISTATALLLVLLLVLLLAGEAAAVQCREQVQRAHGYWAWRLIDGRKCWYEGARGMDKSLLHWPARSSREPAQGSRDKPAQSSQQPAQSRRDKSKASLDETRVKPTGLTAEVAPVPVELLQMLPIMPPKPTFEDRWRLR